MEKHINKFHEQGQETLLSVATREGDVGIIDMLVAKGANVDIATPSETHMLSYYLFLFSIYRGKPVFRCQQ